MPDFNQDDKVLQIQSLLYIAGYTQVGKIDGAIGPNTDAAIEAYAEYNELPLNISIDDLYAHLKETTSNFSGYNSLSFIELAKEAIEIIETSPKSKEKNNAIMAAQGFMRFYGITGRLANSPTPTLVLMDGVKGAQTLHAAERMENIYLKQLSRLQDANIEYFQDVENKKLQQTIDELNEEAEQTQENIDELKEFRKYEDMVNNAAEIYKNYAVSHDHDNKKEKGSKKAKNLDPGLKDILTAFSLAANGVFRESVPTNAKQLREWFKDGGDFHEKGQDGFNANVGDVAFMKDGSMLMVTRVSKNGEVFTGGKDAERQVDLNQVKAFGDSSELMQRIGEVGLSAAMRK